MDLKFNRTPRGKVSSSSLDKLEDLEDLYMNMVDVQDSELKQKVQKATNVIMNKAPVVKKEVEADAESSEYSANQNSKSSNEIIVNQNRKPEVNRANSKDYQDGSNEWLTRIKSNANLQAKNDKVEAFTHDIEKVPESEKSNLLGQEDHQTFRDDIECKEHLSEIDRFSHLPKDTYRSKSNALSSRRSQQQEVKQEQPEGDPATQKTGGGLNALFGGMLSGLNDNIGDVEGPARENWQFCVFQIRKKKYNILKNGISSKLNIPLGPGDESLIMCLNFSDKELKTLLVDMLKVEPIIYYECMLQSPVDKVYEFDDGSIFYNMIINREEFMDTPLILRMIRKKNFGVVVMNQVKGDTFMLSTEIATKFKFKEVVKLKFPKMFAKRRQLRRAVLKSKALEVKNKATEEDEDNGKREVGGVIIQRIKTIMPMNDQEITIDYLLFWISSEGLKRIENFINMILLKEVCEIQEQSRELTMEEEDYLQKIDIFENMYIAAQNAKSSKEQYFEKIIESETASEDFRFLIRHLSSRMVNLSNTTFVIERKLKLSQNTYQMSVDAKMTESSEKLDKLMRQFSLISVMFLPLTVISGMWGMNCKVPYMNVDETTDNLDCFYSLCGVMGGIVVFCLTFFKLKGWI